MLTGAGRLNMTRECNAGELVAAAPGRSAATTNSGMHTQYFLKPGQTLHCHPTHQPEHSSVLQGVGEGVTWLSVTLEAPEMEVTT